MSTVTATANRKRSKPIRLPKTVDVKAGQQFAQQTVMFQKHGSCRVFAVHTGDGLTSDWREFGELTTADVDHLVAVLYWPDGGMVYLNDYQRGVLGRNIERLD